MIGIPVIDLPINELPPAHNIEPTDLLVLQQGEDAMSLPGQVLINWLTAAADGHGGIKSITKIGSSGLVDIYCITLADKTTYTYTVTNGAKGVAGTRGSRWTTGTAITGTSTTATVFSSSGITDVLVNDMYLNTSTGYVYKCTVAGAAAAAKWVYAGSIKGATGATGTILIGKRIKPHKILQYDNKIYHITWNTAQVRLWAVFSYTTISKEGKQVKDNENIGFRFWNKK